MSKDYRFELDCDVSMPHIHDNMEILYVMNGRVGVIYESGNYALKEGEFIVFNAFEHHELYREEGAHTISLFISYSYLRKLEIPMIRCCSANEPELSDYYNMIRGKLAVIYREYLAAGEERDIFCLSQILGILDILKQKFSADDSENKFQAGKLSDVLLFLNQNYSEDITLEETASKCHISPGYLSRSFREIMGMPFSDYLRKLRLAAASSLLYTTDKTITEIGMNAGFGNTNTFINSFKKEYGETPYKARKHGQEKTKDENLQNRTVYDIGLLKYADDEAELAILSKPHLPMMNIAVDMSDKGTCLKQICNVALGSGYAKHLLSDGFGEVISRIGVDIHPEYLQIQGIFDDNLHAYVVHADGTVTYDFFMTDQVIEKICNAKMKPWIELGRTPEAFAPAGKNIFHGAYVELPEDIDKWCKFVDAFIGHIIDRYGRQTVEGWRFSIMPALYVSYDIFTLDDYLIYYKSTYEVLVKKLPKVTLTGGTFDCGLLRTDGTTDLKKFLRYCIDNDCLPTLLSVQEFFADYEKANRMKVKCTMDLSDREPVPPSDDPSVMSKDIDMIERVYEELGISPIPITFMYWNSTIWGEDLCNDTCYNAAFLVKHTIDCIGKIDSAVASVAFNAEDSDELFTGSSALFTQGIPKAMYHAYKLLEMMNENYVSRGECYAISRTKDGSEYTIIMHNYCPPDPQVHLSEIVSRQEQRTIDRYYSYKQTGVRNYCISFNGVNNGKWVMETYRICRECGSSYDFWRKMGAPSTLGQRQKKYLEDISQPGYYIDEIQASGSHMMISGTMDEHEVRFIRIKLEKM